MTHFALEPPRNVRAKCPKHEVKHGAMAIWAGLKMEYLAQNDQFYSDRRPKIMLKHQIWRYPVSNYRRSHEGRGDFRSFRIPNATKATRRFTSDWDDA